MLVRRTLFMLVIIFFSIQVFAQSKVSPFEKFGKITTQDLQRKIYDIDSSANSVVLSDIGDVKIQGNRDGWFSLVTRRHVVIHILDKNGYDAANVSVRLYGVGSDAEMISQIKGVTYNLENGKMIQTKLEKSGQFKEKIDDKRQVVKFTMPQIKEGSIIEYEYTVTSQYIMEPDPWYFQSTQRPVLWSEYKFTTPIFFNYQFHNQGYHRFSISDKKSRNEHFTIIESNNSRANDRYDFNSLVSELRWVAENVPELNSERFTSSIMNHVTRINAQLMEQTTPLTPRTFRTTWKEVMNNLLASEQFGSKLTANNNWMKADVDPLIKDEFNNLERAKRIFAFVRDNFKTTGRKGIYINNSLRDIFKSRTGSPVEINLLLTAMLNYANLSATPVVLSTRDNGFVSALSPMINNMNHVVTQFEDNGKIYYLDASVPRLGFNKMPLENYNGHARLVNKNGDPVFFPADSIKENKSTSFFFMNDEKGEWGGSATSNLGYYESLRMRDQIAEKGLNSVVKELTDSYTNGKLTHVTIEGINDLEKNITVKYEMYPDTKDLSLIYLNPTFSEGYKKNPFVSETRTYPVELPYTSTETIVCSIQTPQGFEIEEIPRSAKINLDDGSGIEYLISRSEDQLSFKCILKMGKTEYSPNDYLLLREFYNHVVKKQAEQIVFKKK